MHEVVQELLKDFRMTFSSLEEGLAQRLDPERAFLDPAKPKRGTAKPRQAMARGRRAAALRGNGIATNHGRSTATDATGTIS